MPVGGGRRPEMKDPRREKEVDMELRRKEARDLGTLCTYTNNLHQKKKSEILLQSYNFECRIVMLVYLLFWFSDFFLLNITPCEDNNSRRESTKSQQQQHQQ
ncbi:hypothetical protein KQX54_016065 [Cotesia glomerata]|uniref:Uncharacterized protein n=1 Tax=Cotesia glomerata TaxID=32391 RepID=A0AAV7ICE7_COTGL|nr:hypothetical protein KQX54_016065 [Cotesia glomerata]